MQREAVIADVRFKLLDADVALLNDHGVADSVMSIVAAEHAARVETLCKAVEPTLGRTLLLQIAKALMGAAAEIGVATVQQPELIHVA